MCTLDWFSLRTWACVIATCNQVVFKRLGGGGISSQQVLHGRISEQRMLVGNNANDGVPLSDPTVVDGQGFDAHLNLTFPNLTADDKAAPNRVYRTKWTEQANTGIGFDTLGNSGATALGHSGMATGLQ
ncbi:hypothetical protein BJX68DRAFT_272528 [Aspergillus pseudodeflectus]|uniref:Uncharacterized protein n=1 Tax=Aspergillus pseudodeflectus TaxID=176178 RepID=A0ABR4JEX6_9EURO